MGNLQNVISLTVFMISIIGWDICKGHTMGLGSCPKVERLKEFDMKRFMGEWYVIQKFATSSSCMKYNFTQGPDGDMRIVQTRQHYLLDTIGVDHTYTYTGVLTVPDTDRPSRMRVRFPLNVAGEADLIVFMTDYDTYAGMFTCQKILFGHSMCASILSRKPTLDKAIVNQIRQKLEEDGVDPDDFSVVDQTYCKNSDDITLKVKIDDKTFSAKNVAGVVKQVGGAVGLGLEKAGDALSSGINKAADVTGDLVETFGERDPSKIIGSDHDLEPKTNLTKLLDNAKDTENEANEWLP